MAAPEWKKRLDAEIAELDQRIATFKREWTPETLLQFAERLVESGRTILSIHQELAPPDPAESGTPAPPSPDPFPATGTSTGSESTASSPTPGSDPSSPPSSPTETGSGSSEATPSSSPKTEESATG